ncbi:MAG: DUF2231 domain-containing protein [Bacteroidota bacterium]
MDTHPALVHFPLGFALASWIAETQRTWVAPSGAQTVFWEALGRVMLWWTLPALMLAIVSGNLAHDTHGPQGQNPSVGVLENHEALGYASAAVLVLLAFWRSVRSRAMSLLEQRGYWLILTLSLGFMFWGAYLGGRLVYQHGVGVHPSALSSSRIFPHF